MTNPFTELLIRDHFFSDLCLMGNHSGNRTVVGSFRGRSEAVLGTGRRPSMSWFFSDDGRGTMDPFWRKRVAPFLLPVTFLHRCFQHASIPILRSPCDEANNSRPSLLIPSQIPVGRCPAAIYTPPAQFRAVVVRSRDLKRPLIGTIRSRRTL